MRHNISESLSIAAFSAVFPGVFWYKKKEQCVFYCERRKGITDMQDINIRIIRACIGWRTKKRNKIMIQTLDYLIMSSSAFRSRRTHIFIAFLCLGRLNFMGNDLLASERMGVRVF